MTSNNKTILLTGATGFIGGSILTHLLESSEPAIRNAQITCLLRGADRAEKLSSTYGNRVKPVLYEGIDDLDTTVAVAAQHDVVINATIGFHPSSTEALIKGLAKRKALTGSGVWMIHTSGTSNIGDKPVTNPNAPVHIFDDIADDVYGHEMALDAEQPYPQRTTELAVVNTGLALDVNTLAIMSPVIYGNGMGIFNQTSAQTFFYRAVLSRKKSAVVGEGRNILGHVHIADLADLYKLILLEILDRNGQHLPSGKKGIIFSAHGENTVIREAELIAAAGHELGVLPEKTVEHLSLEVAAREFLPHLGYFTKEEIEAEGARIVEGMLASNGRTVPSVAHRLGWKPSKGEDAWEQAVKDNVKSQAAVLGLL